MIDIKYITSNSDLEKLVLRLKNMNKIAIDLEFDSNHHHYGFNLCLMQLYCGSEAFLVDPLVVDVRLIFPFLEDKNIQKVVFSFGEDLRLLHSLGCKPKNIYDISIAIKLLDYEKISLADALRVNMQIELEKGSQKSDWCKRPFTDKQKIYAANDVIYLFDLLRIVKNQASDKGISKWIEEENADLENIYLNEKTINTIKRKNSFKMTEFEWFFYQELWKLRERKAEELDKPAHQIINNEFLKEIAFNPKLIRNWKNNKFIHHALKNDSFGRQIYKLYKKCEKEADIIGISKVKPQIKPLSKEEIRKNRERKNNIETVKEKVFKPIQNCIRRDYGEYAYTHILSNKTMENIIDGKPLLNYKRELISKYAKETKLDIKKYL